MPLKLPLDYTELGDQIRKWYRYQREMIDASGYWSHEEQMELSQSYGCILTHHEGRWQLMALRTDTKSDPLRAVQENAPLDPLCEKVLSYVIAGKLSEKHQR